MGEAAKPQLVRLKAQNSTTWQHASSKANEHLETEQSAMHALAADMVQVQLANVSLMRTVVVMASELHVVTVMPSKMPLAGHKCLPYQR